MSDAYTSTTTISLTEGERAELASMARSRSLPAHWRCVRGPCWLVKVLLPIANNRLAKKMPSPRR